MKVLEHQARVTAVAVNTASSKKNVHPKVPMVMKNVMAVGQVKYECAVCKGDHLVFKCDGFLKLAVPERINLAKKLRLCFNCLRGGHGVRQCVSGQCRRCQKPHHTLLHIEKEGAAAVQEVVAAGQVAAVQRVLLATALIKVSGGHGASVVCRAFLDNGSQASFITVKCLQALMLPCKKVLLSVTGVATSTKKVVRSGAQLVFKSLHGHQEFVTEVLVLPSIANMLPTSRVDTSMWHHLEGLQLADLQFFEPRQVDILLGADVYYQLVHGESGGNSYCQPSVINTALGWIVAGPIPIEQKEPSITSQVSVCHIRLDTDMLLQRFWEVEGVPQVSHLTEEEQLCENHFAATVCCGLGGRFEVRLPFREASPILG